MSKKKKKSNKKPIPTGPMPTEDAAKVLGRNPRALNEAICKGRIPRPPKLNGEKSFSPFVWTKEHILAAARAMLADGYWAPAIDSPDYDWSDLV